VPQLIGSGIIGEINRPSAIRLHLPLLYNKQNEIELDVCSISISLLGKEKYASLTSGGQHFIIITEILSSPVTRIKTLAILSDIPGNFYHSVYTDTAASEIDFHALFSNDLAVFLMAP
jgi:hypothetical protein